tara:strand:- start:408 stop:755 length:348 start_codon:yes stop_codon:yes gene_type:complete
MATKYVEITLEEIKEILRPEKGWVPVDGFREHVFQWPLPRWPWIVIKVYTSIRKDSATGRSKGSDAIRVCCVDTKRDVGVIGKNRLKRVHRVEGWRDNLKDRLLLAVKLLREAFK